MELPSFSFVGEAEATAWGHHSLSWFPSILCAFLGSLNTGWGERGGMMLTSRGGSVIFLQGVTDVLVPLLSRWVYILLPVPSSVDLGTARVAIGLFV